MYGPDTLQGRMFDRVGASDVRGPALLKGYRLSFNKPNMKNKREGFANVREEDDSKVFGVVFELSQSQIDILDGFFGGYEQRKVRPDVINKTPSENEDAEPTLELTPVTAVTWIARRTGRNLRPSHLNFRSTIEGLEQNEAPNVFTEELKEFEPLPSETVELMVKFKRGIPEEDARTMMSAAGGKIRRKMRTDHADEIQLLVQFPRSRADELEDQFKQLPQITLVERNSDDYHLL